MFRRIAALLSALMLAFGCMAFAACEDGTVGTGGGNGTGEGGSEGEQTVEVTSVTLDRTSLTLAEGESAQLTATVLPADATQKTVTWTSSAPAIATVADGLVTALAAGEATVTAACGSVQASCTVTVTPVFAPVTSEEWEAAFDLSKYDDLSVVVHATMPAESIDMDMIEYTAADGLESFCSRIEGETWLYSLSAQEGYTVYTCSKGSCMIEASQTSLYTAQLAPFLTQFFADIPERYTEFSKQYSEQDGCYCGTATVDNEQVNVTLYFSAGRLIGAEYSHDDAAYDIKFSYAGNSVTLPQPNAPALEQGDEVSAAQWKAAFAIDKIPGTTLTAGVCVYTEEGELVGFTNREYCVMIGEGEQLYSSRLYTYGEWQYAVEQNGTWTVYEQQSGTWTIVSSGKQSPYAASNIAQPLTLIGAADLPQFDAKLGGYAGTIDLDGTTANYRAYFREGRLITLVLSANADLSVGLQEYTVNFEYGTLEFPALGG